MIASAAPAQPGAAARIVRRYPAPEATQAAAVDDAFFYAIGNSAIGKYDKQSGRRVAQWHEAPKGRLVHLNSGIVIDSLLYCAHSNYPELPMVSSIEVFDTKQLRPVRTIALPDGRGSATWVEQADGAWWVTFAHYAGKGGEPGKGPEATTLVKFDQDWRAQQSWSFPSAVVNRWDGMSSSGGVGIGNGRFITTGHHAPELYVVNLPKTGGVLMLGAIVPIESEGQGIAFDRREQQLYSIQRRTREVLVSEMPGSVQ